MLSLVFSKDGLAVADELVKETVMGILIKHEEIGNLEVSIGTDLMLCQFRLFVKNEIISHNDIEVYINSTNNARIRIDKFGNLESWEGFPDITTNLLSDLIGW